MKGGGRRMKMECLGIEDTNFAVVYPKNRQEEAEAFMNICDVLSEKEVLDCCLEDLKVLAPALGMILANEEVEGSIRCLR
mgnify:FL=1